MECFFNSKRNVNVIYFKHLSSHSCSPFVRSCVRSVSALFSAMCAHTHNSNFLNRITHSSKLFSLFPFFACRCRRREWRNSSFVHSHNLSIGYASVRSIHATLCSFSLIFALFFSLASHFIIFNAFFILSLSCHSWFDVLVHAIYYKFNHNDVGNFNIHFAVILVPCSAHLRPRIFVSARVLGWSYVVLPSIHRFFSINLVFSILLFLSNHTFVWLLSLSLSSLLLNDEDDERNMKNII